MDTGLVETRVPNFAMGALRPQKECREDHSVSYAAAVAPTAIKFGVPPRPMRAANDNGGRRVTVNLRPAPAIAVAEIEVFGALLAQIDGDAANDNAWDGGA